MSDEKMRAEFEVWLLEVLNNADMEDITNYLFDDDDEATLCITAMWLAWQESRAALVIELPKASRQVTWDDESMDVMWPCELIEAIEAAGVQVKS